MRSGFLKTGLAAILAGLLLVLPFADLSSMAAQLYAASETTASLSESSSSSVLNESSVATAESSQAQSSVSVSESSTSMTSESSTSTGVPRESTTSETAGAASSTPVSETTSVPASSSSVVVSESTSGSASSSETTSPSSTGSTVPVARMQMALMAVAGDFSYDVTAEGVVITGLADGVTITDIVIPAEIDGQKVVAIAEKAFMQKDITRVTIGPNVKTIGEYAFAANQITSLTYDDSLNTPVELKQYAFRDNLLTSVDTKNVTKIGAEAFANNKLTSVTFGNVGEFGTRAFVNNSLIEVSIQSAVTAYGAGVFSYNDRYVLVKTLSTNTLIKTERIPDGFGQVVNPVTVTIIHVDKNAPTVSLIDDVIWGTDYTNPDGIVVLNTTNTYIPPTIEGYSASLNSHSSYQLGRCFQ